MKTCPKSLNYRYAGFQILDWNSNFQSPLVRTTDKLLQIFTHKDLFTIKISFMKILFIIAVYHVRDTMAQSLVHTAGICFSLPHFDTILHIAVINFFLWITHIFKINYFQFYPSRKALVIKTNVFTIIISLNPFFTNLNINWQR